jgi:uncharacterized PurR-regulated membrane protein YhhQ (DUF165 family)
VRRLIPIAVFAAAAVLANWLTTVFGFVPVGFGFAATAGTYAAGVALVARDFIHETSGLRGVAVAVGIGTGLSLILTDPAIAVASGVAFLVSEVADTFVYAPLRERRWRLAVIASSVVGAIVDTLLFLSLAFGLAALTGEAVGGQLVGKVLWVAVPVAIVGGHIRNRRSRNV